MTLKKTPFHAIHKAAGGRLVEFAGFEMPVQFAGILEEHRAVRTGVGIFDVSHMGEVWVRGPEALRALQVLVTNDVSTLINGQAQYTAMCNERGGIVDDLIVYRFSAELFLICVNASNREKDFQWMVEHNPTPRTAIFSDEGDEWGQLAIQGRPTESILQHLTPVDLSKIGTYHHATGPMAGVEGCIIARTGYTGEDGFEIFVPPAGAERLYAGIMEHGAIHGIQPIGLGARDTLRLEARYCLYGNDINDDTTPLEAGLGWVTKLDKGVPFIGMPILVAQKAAGIPRTLVGMTVANRIARQHMPILAEGKPVGEVTSGTRSPSLDVNIALGYVPRSLAKPGTHVQIDVRGKAADAEVVKGPFYRRPY